MTVEFVDMGIAHNSMFNGLFQKKKQMGWLRMWSFQGFQRNSMQNFQGLIKNKVGFPRVIKNHVEYPRVLSLGLAICRGLTQFCGISMGKALFCLEFMWVKEETKNLQDFFQKMYVLKPAPHLFGFLQNNPIINSMATWTIAVHDFQTPICTVNSLREIFFVKVKIPCKHLLAFMSFWKNPMWHKQSFMHFLWAN